MNQYKHDSVLVIGLSQSGKSTFSNCFINDWNNEGETTIRGPFKVGGLGRSVTEVIQEATFWFNNKNYKIIDTPGLGDSKTPDETIYKSMIGLLNMNNRIISVVLIYKYGNIINKEVRERLKLYKSIIPELKTLLKLVIVDMTVDNIENCIESSESVEKFCNRIRVDISEAVGFSINTVYYQNSRPKTSLEVKKIQDNKENILFDIQGTVDLNSSLEKPKFMMDRHENIIRRIKNKIENLENLMNRMDNESISSKGAILLSTSKSVNISTPVDVSTCLSTKTIYVNTVVLPKSFIDPMIIDCDSNEIKINAKNLNTM